MDWRIAERRAEGFRGGFGRVNTVAHIPVIVRTSSFRRSRPIISVIENKKLRQEVLTHPLPKRKKNKKNAYSSSRP